MPEQLTVGQKGLRDLERELGITVGDRPMPAAEVKLEADYTSGKYRVLPLPFPLATRAAVGPFNMQANADKAAKPIKLIMSVQSDQMVGMAAEPVVTVDAINVQGTNQMLAQGQGPFDAFAADAPAEDLPWDFAVLATSGAFVLGLNVISPAPMVGQLFIAALAKVITSQ